MASEKIETLLDEYFALGVAEGREGRTHDTPDGDAQRVRSAISSALAAQDDQPVAWPDWTVSASETAREVLSRLGIGSDASLEPGAEPRRDTVARIITAHFDRMVSEGQTGDIRETAWYRNAKSIAAAIRALSSEPVEKGDR